MPSPPSSSDALDARNHVAGSHVAGAYALAVSGTSAALTLPVGFYKVWIGARTATTSVFVKIGAAATIPADATVDANVYGFPGDETVYVEIKDGDSAKTLNAILTTGTDTLYAVRL